MAVSSARGKAPAITITKAEGKGFEPSTHCWASDFESDRWPIRIPSEMNSLRVYQTLEPCECPIL